MDENITPPGSDTPPPPPPGSHEPTGDQTGTQAGTQSGNQYGPRVSGADIRDVSRLTRSSTDRHIAGVAGGVARHLDIDPILVRVGFVVLAFFGGAGIFLYGALWLLLPDDREGDRATVDLDPRNRSLAVLAVGGLAALVFFGNAFGIGADHDGFFFPAIPLLIIAGIAFLVIRKREWRRQQRLGGGAPAWSYAAPPAARYADPYAGPAAAAYGAPVGAQQDPTFQEDVRNNPEKYRDMRAWKIRGDYRTGYRWERDPRKRGPLLFWIALPLIAVALGILGVIDLGGTDVIPAAYPALALAIVASLLLLGSFWGRAGGLIFLGLLLIPATLISTAADNWDGKEITYRPTSVAQLEQHGFEYREDTGRLTLDLTAIRPADLASLDHEISAGLALGEVEIIVPSTIDVEATAKTNGPGGFELFGQEDGGIQTSKTVDQDSPSTEGKLFVNAEVNVGHITVRSN